MRRFLKKIERRHSHTQGTHVDIYGDLRDEYGVLISDKPPLSKRRRGKRKVVTGSSLERLPVEIKVLILQNADISTLKALVHASPLLHQAYRDQRRTILSAALTGTIPPGLFFEARFLFKVANILSQHIPERDARRSELLAEYHENRRHASYVGEALDFKDLISMANYQLMIEKIASRYCKEMLSEHPVTGAKLASWKPPRQTELTRLYRALYRFQLYCIFFQEKISTAAPQTGRLSVMALSRLFLSRFEIWEVEELACIGKYILDQYDFILRQHGNQDAADGKKDYPRQRVRPDASYYMHRFEEKKEYCMSLGLEHFHRVSTAGTRSRQYSLLVCNLSDEETNLAWALSAYHKSQQRAHRAQGINPDMFNDVRFVSEEAWGPNSGFLWSKGAKPWDFDEINNGHRDWGYVFWDKWRLKGWGVLKMNRRAWRRQGLEGRSMSR